MHTINMATRSFFLMVVVVVRISVIERRRRGALSLETKGQHFLYSTSALRKSLLLVSLSSRLFFPSVKGAIELCCSLELRLSISDFYSSRLCNASRSYPVLQFLVPQRYPAVSSESLAPLLGVPSPDDLYPALFANKIVDHYSLHSPSFCSCRMAHSVPNSSKAAGSNFWSRIFFGMSVCGNEPFFWVS